MSHCTAMSKRSKERCRRWALWGKSTCYMHGGKSTGPKTKSGREKARRAVLKHGGYTSTALAQYQEAIMLIRQCKALLRSIE